jgi:hypothetical protein
VINAPAGDKKLIRALSFDCPGSPPQLQPCADKANPQIKKSPIHPIFRHTHHIHILLYRSPTTDKPKTMTVA